MTLPKLIEWRPEYELGLAAVDAEHRELITLINELHAELDEPVDAEAVELLLGEIYAAIAAHFALEEREMMAAGYPEYVAHKADHEALLDQLLGMMDELAGDSSAALDGLGQRLKAWFVDHFSTFDARLHGALDRPHG